MRLLFGAAAVLLTAACASGAPQATARREALTRQIADDAAAFNEAYAQAVSSQILLNILRSRDRLPRQYLAMTGISDAPSVTETRSASVGGIPFGDIGSPWGVGGAGIERETAVRPGYAVQPYDADALTRTVFDPTEPFVFAHYWRSGWPRDLLMLVMVERISVQPAQGRAREYVNEANEIFGNCTDDVQTGGCDFVRTLRDFLSRTGEPAELSTARTAQAICGLVEAYAPRRPVRAVAPAEGQRCDPVFVVGGDRYTVSLRSLDDMVYYVGELMRAPGMNAGPDDAIEATVLVRAAGLRGGGRGVPLFRLLPPGAAPARIYAAEVMYGGVRYRAGPAISRSCAEATLDGPCRDIPEEGDRSSSVISLIAEIFALNQSPDAIRPPDRLIAE